MNRPTVSAVLAAKSVIVIATVDDASNAGRLATVLADSGVAALEITMRTPQALDALHAASAQQGLIVGAEQSIAQRMPTRLSRPVPRFWSHRPWTWGS